MHQDSKQDKLKQEMDENIEKEKLQTKNELNEIKK